MVRSALVLGVLAVSLLAACGGDVDVPSGAGGHGGDPSATTIITTTTIATTTTGPSCDVAFSDGCCFGDGICCPCAASACGFTSTHEQQLALTDCLCQPDVCGLECQYACQGQGIDLSCFVCGARAATDACKGPYDACGGQPSLCGPTSSSCYECVGCSQPGGCYDAWHACWFDGECQAVMICAGDGTLASLQGCAAQHPSAGALVDAYIACAFCGACGTECAAETAGRCPAGG